MPYIAAVVLAALGFVLGGLALAGLLGADRGGPVDRAQWTVGFVIGGILLGLVVGGATQLIAIVQDLRARRDAARHR
jgi:hypothetical protein